MPSCHLTLAYDGTAFHGWQHQPDTRTVEGVLRNAFSHIHANLITLAGASRTDAGVHASGQSVSVSYSKNILPEKLLCALNGVLPEDVRIVSARSVPDDFHATRDAYGKQYVYSFWLAAVDDPCSRHTHMWVRHSLDISAMRMAADNLTGTRDFSGIYVRSRNQEQSTVRTVDALLISVDLPLLRIRVFGRSFMYKMVRSLAGIIYSVGRNYHIPDDIPEILCGEPSRRRSHVAPAHGLSLLRVYYDVDSYEKDITFFSEVD